MFIKIFSYLNPFVLIFILIIENRVFAENVPKEIPWEIVSDEKGFITKRRKSPNSNIFAFRGETLADVPIGQVLTVFMDRSLRKDWVHMFGEQKDLEVKNDLDKVYWIRFATPMIMSDRDYVLQLKGDIDNASHVMTAKITSVTHPSKGVDTCCVRAHAFGTFYRFEARGSKTFIEVEVQTDPKGWIPKWLVNFIQKSWPKKTLTRLIELAKKSTSDMDPRFVGWDQSPPTK